PREENTRADQLSMLYAQSHTLTKAAEREIREWLDTLGLPGMRENTWLQTRVQVPVFQHIMERLQEMVGSRKPACIVVPRWKGRPWVPLLHKHTLHTRALGTVRETLMPSDKRDTTTHAW